MLKKTLFFAVLLLFATMSYAWSCTTTEDTPVASRQGDFLKAINHFENNNLSAVTEMGNSGKLFIIPGGRSVKEISTDGRLANIDFNGRSGWTFRSFLYCR